MKFIVSDTINFLSKTFPKIYSSLYLEYLKQYASTYSVNKTQLRALITLKYNGIGILYSKLSNQSYYDLGYISQEKDLQLGDAYIIENKKYVNFINYILINPLC